MKNIMAIFLFAILLGVLSFCMFSCEERCHCNVDSGIAQYNDSVLSEIDFKANWDRLKLPQLSPGGHRLSYSSAFTPEKIYYTLIPDQGSPYVLKQIRKNGIEDVISTERIEVDPSKLKRFADLLDEECFWTMKCDPAPMLEGVVWGIEAKRIYNSPCSFNKHHHVYRYTHDTTFMQTFRDGFFDMMNLD